MKQLKFNAEMAQAVKDGRKTQFREPIKHGDIVFLKEDREKLMQHIAKLYAYYDRSMAEREAYHQTKNQCHYKIGDIHDVEGTQIRITNIRVERLQDISEEDAIAEGVQIIGGCELAGTGDYCDYGYYVGELKYTKDLMNYSTTFYDEAEAAFASEIWDKLTYQPPYDWNSNPYVWVIEFEVLDEEVKEAQEKFEKSGVLVL